MIYEDKLVFFETELYRRIVICIKIVKTWPHNAMPDHNHEENYEIGRKIPEICQS